MDERTRASGTHYPKLVAQGAIRIVAEPKSADDETWAVEVAVTARNGTSGGIRTELPMEQLLEAIRTVAAGEPWQPPVRREPNGCSSLTPCEESVARLVAKGMRNAEVARELFVTEGTIKTHLNRAFRKLGVRNRAELTRLLLSRPVAGPARAA